MCAFKKRNNNVKRSLKKNKNENFTFLKKFLAEKYSKFNFKIIRTNEH